VETDGHFAGRNRRDIAVIDRAKQAVISPCGFDDDEPVATVPVKNTINVLRTAAVRCTALLLDAHRVYAIHNEAVGRRGKYSTDDFSRDRCRVCMSTHRNYKRATDTGGSTIRRVNGMFPINFKI